MSSKRLRWKTYEILVTLVPERLAGQAIKEATAVMQQLTVSALDDKMAGTIACQQAEELFEGYQAIYWEQV